jgi:hypothetical protein
MAKIGPDKIIFIFILILNCFLLIDDNHFGYKQKKNPNINLKNKTLQQRKTMPTTAVGLPCATRACVCATKQQPKQQSRRSSHDNKPNKKTNTVVVFGVIIPFFVQTFSSSSSSSTVCSSLFLFLLLLLHFICSFIDT